MLVWPKSRVVADTLRWRGDVVDTRCVVLLSPPVVFHAVEEVVEVVEVVAGEELLSEDVGVGEAVDVVVEVDVLVVLVVVVVLVTPSTIRGSQATLRSLNIYFLRNFQSLAPKTSNNLKKLPFVPISIFIAIFQLCGDIREFWLTFHVSYMESEHFLCYKIQFSLPA